jgi:hypothetical protein
MAEQSQRRWRHFDGRYSFEVTLGAGEVSLFEEDTTPAGGGGTTTCALADYADWSSRRWIAESMGTRMEQAIARAVGSKLGSEIPPLGPKPPPDPNIQRVLLSLNLRRGATWSLADDARAVDLDVPVGQERRTLAEEAVVLGNHGGLKTLLECGASPDPMPGRSALWLAVERDDAEAVALLLAAGARRDVVVDGCTVEDHARARGDAAVLGALGIELQR